MSDKKIWVRLGMRRKQGKIVWFDDTPAEPSDGALYNERNTDDPSSEASEICASMNFLDRGCNNSKCDYNPFQGPSDLCQNSKGKKRLPII